MDLAFGWVGTLESGMCLIATIDLEFQLAAIQGLGNGLTASVNLKVLLAALTVLAAPQSESLSCASKSSFNFHRLVLCTIRSSGGQR